MRENDKVTLLTKGYEGRIGTIDMIVNEDIYIVQLEDKTLVKCRLADLVPMTTEETSDPDTITITRDELVRAIAESVGDILLEKPLDPQLVVLLTLHGGLIVNRVTAILFDRG